MNNKRMKIKTLGSVALPAGKLKFIHVHKPDTAFSDEGMFSVSLVLNAEKTQELKDLLINLVGDAEKFKKLNKPVKSLEKGFTVTKVSRKTGLTRAITVEGIGEPLENSFGIVHATIKEYEGNKMIAAGLTFQLDKVTVLKHPEEQSEEVSLKTIAKKVDSKVSKKKETVSNDDPFGEIPF